MLFILLLTALTATSGEDTHKHYSEGRGTCRGEGVSLLPSGLAGSGSQEEGASLTWTGGHTTGEGEKEIHFYKSTFSIYIYMLHVILDHYTQF